MSFVSNILLTWYYIKHGNQIAIQFFYGFKKLTLKESNAYKNASQCLLKSYLSCLTIYIYRYFVLNSAKV